MGLVGESSSGKSTLAHAIVGLAERTDGEIELLSSPLPSKIGERSQEMLRQLQIVFQNPQEALNPHLTIGESLSRPFVTLMSKSRKEAQQLAEKLLTAVRLPVDYANRLPAQLSGGELQRVAIARAFAVNPDVLILDEPVSALDVSVQASILNLINELRTDRGTSILFISHDIAVVGYLADEIAVMYLGRLVQTTPARDLLQPPYHPYTEALLSAIPLPDPGIHQKHIRLTGDVPSAVDVPPGCPFHPRCPRYIGDVCVGKAPPWQTGENDKRIRCHIRFDELRAMQDRVIHLQQEARDSWSAKPVHNGDTEQEEGDTEDTDSCHNTSYNG
jgi:peptide/nickel transport system ATP-binding protein